MAEQWESITVLKPFDLNAPCVRGHIPRSLNSGTGTAYGTFIKGQRLVDGERFWVSVTD